MSHHKLVVFCTTCKGRAQHIERTLPKNIKDNDGSNCKFVILDYSSPDHLLQYIKTAHGDDLSSGKLTVYSLKNAGAFKMAHAKNMAHRLGILEGGDILVNLDADNLTNPGFADYILEKFDTPKSIFLYAKMIQTGEDRLPRGINGRIVVSRHAFINAGGYDEKYSTWAPDDKDFNARLQRLGYHGIEIDKKYLSGVMHSDKMRFKEYRHVQTTMNEEDFELVASSEDTIANWGKFGEGVVFKNFGMDPIPIRRVPTRIFGIGMHKTATTSLHTALKILKFDSAHWKSAHWAKAIWSEMIAMGKSSTLEQHYALTDLPLPLLYKQLDKAYPGSKFILTVRDEQKWLRSVEKHWSYDYNQFRASWDHDPFSHRIHKELYGINTFNAAVFLAKYRQHNAEVKDYFKSRPEDLLVMHMDKDEGWAELCSFLNCPVPVISYPRQFVTEYSGLGSGI